MKEPLLYDPSFDELTSYEKGLLEESLKYVKEYVIQSDKISHVNYATRDAHAKTYAYVKGKFIPSNDRYIRESFSEISYDALVRFSHAHLKIVATDQQMPLYGLSLKINVNDIECINFPLVNFPLFITNSVPKFLKVFIKVNQLFTKSLVEKPKHFFGLLRELLPLPLGMMNKSFINAVNDFRVKYYYFILARNYHSIGVFRLGNTLIKLKAVPTQFDPDYKSGKSINEQIKNYISSNNFSFKIYYSMAYDVKDHPINNLLKKWENETEIYFGEVKFEQVIEDTLDMEKLSFNPFDNPESFQPVGKIQKIREKIYQTSINTRNSINDEKKMH